MRNEAEHHYSPSRSFFRKLFQFISEFLWTYPSKSSDYDDAKNRHNWSTLPRQTVVDFFSLLVLCAILVTIVFITMKCYKESDDDDDEDGESIAKNNTGNIDREDKQTKPIFKNIPSSGLETLNDQSKIANDFNRKSIRQHAGNSVVTPCMNCESTNDYLNFLNFPDFIESISSTNSMGASLLRGSTRECPKKCNTFSRRTPLNYIKYHHRSHHYRSKLSDRDWFLRRTRSGQIYGRYSIL